MENIKATIRRWWQELYWTEKFVFICTVVNVVCTVVNGIKLLSP